MLSRNVGTVDRIVRAMLALGLLGAGFSPLPAGRRRWWAYALAVTGAVLGFTAITSHCTVYSVLGVSTAEK